MKYHTYLNEISNTVAYWISPTGKAINVGTNHVTAIIKNPKTFGMTSDHVKAIFDKFNEPIGQEGKAREELILELVNKGWIRIRRYRNEGYSVTIGSMTKKVKDILFSWADTMLNTGVNGNKETDKYIPVKIIGFKDHYTRNLTIFDLANDALYEGKEFFDIKNKIVENCDEDFEM
jgi:hypothetical protein